MFDFFRIPGTTSVHEMKLAAWALFVGERSRGRVSADRVARSHRGMLPDVDPASAVPDPNHRPLIRRRAVERSPAREASDLDHPRAA